MAIKSSEKSLLDKESVKFLKTRKSLLAFSHGSDSSALFHLLTEAGVSFDVVFINYNTRPGSILEERGTRELCQKFDKKCYVKSVKFDLNSGDFEKRAREIRYEFFDEICAKFGYDTLITAHQLNDLFEWFLMRLSRGAGLCNLIGMSTVEPRTHFTLVRPMLFCEKSKILGYLERNKIKFFNDESNANLKFERNFIRAKFSDEFIAKYSQGVANSMRFLSLDKQTLLTQPIFDENGLCIIPKNGAWQDSVDKIIKKFGVLLSQKERAKISSDCVIADFICISHNENFVFINPKITQTMPKHFKEYARKQSLGKYVRSYIFTHQNLLDKLLNLGIVRHKFINKNN